MKSFSTADAKYTFEVDGKPYVLPVLSYDDLDAVGEILSAAPAEVKDRLYGFFEKRSDKRTYALIRRLPVPYVRELFFDWAGIVQPGVTPGESVSSPDSAASTDDN